MGFTVRSIHPALWVSSARWQFHRAIPTDARARILTDQLGFNPENAEGLTTKYTQHPKRTGAGIAVFAPVSPLKGGFSLSGSLMQPPPGPLGFHFRVLRVFRGSNEWFRLKFPETFWPVAGYYPWNFEFLNRNQKKSL
jgi:hypothetical protein